MKRPQRSRHPLRGPSLSALVALGCAGGGGSPRLSIGGTPPADATMREVYAFQAVARDADGPVAWSLDSAPPGMQVDSAGLVEWTPQYADVGAHAIALRATDASTSATRAWSLDVHQGLDLGVTVSPRGHENATTQQDWIDFWSGHASHGRVIGFHTHWRDPGQSQGEVPLLAQVAIAGSQQYGYVPTIGFGWADGDGDPDLTSDSDPLDNSWQNAETRAEFLAMVAGFAAASRPPYLFLGNEVNTYWATHTPGEWSAWVSEYEACYDAITAVSPATVVFTVFQLERLKGLGAATTGWTDPPHWQLADQLVASGKLDALGFTSYPYFEHATPAAISAGYYDEIGQHWTGPVIFTEIGWLAAAHLPYPGGEQDQADFVATFFDRTQALDLGYVEWLFLHDWDGQAAAPSIADIGLRSNDGAVVRAADGAWRAAVSLRE